MHFAPSKCKVLLQDWSGPNPNLAEQSIEVVGKFIYLGSCKSPGGLIKDVMLRIDKARAAFSSLQHLWRRRDIRLSIKGRVYHHHGQQHQSCDFGALLPHNTMIN